MLNVAHVTLSRGGRTLIEDASFRLARGEKVGLVGVNGAGKTTLLRALQGQVDPDAGTIDCGGRLGYLGQERLADDLLTGSASVREGNGGTQVTVRDVMLAGRDLGRLAAEMRAIEARMARDASAPDALLARYGELEEQFSRAGGYAAEHDIVQMLAGLGLSAVALEQQVSALSGGQKTRLALARVLFGAPDMMLLDEPTNHLDGAATRWLMDYLARFAGAVLLVSHDLALLDRAISRVLHLDAATRTVTAYSGNYSSYLRQRKQAEETAEAQSQRQRTKIARLEEQADWMRGKTAKMARRAKVLDHVVERLREQMPDPASLPRRERALALDLPISRQSGRVVFKCERLTKSYGGPAVFTDLSFQVERGQRLVVLGRNGAGKTTLLRVLAGLAQPTRGRLEVGQMVDVGYYAQEHEALHAGLTLLEEMRLAASEMPLAGSKPPSDGQLRSLLGRFLFSGGQAFQKVGSLSGGEKTRLALARLMLGGYNTLLLDEPTNNLDTTSRDQVREALETYRGTLIIVSHDTEFVEALRPERALLLPAGAMRFFDETQLALVAKV